MDSTNTNRCTYIRICVLVEFLLELQVVLSERFAYSSSNYTGGEDGQGQGRPSRKTGAKILCSL